MANKWHKYFDEDDAKFCNIIKFHENWCRIHENDLEKLPYNKANDALNKSLRAIANKSPDVEKIRTANLLMMLQASIYFIFMCDLVCNREPTNLSQLLVAFDGLLDRAHLWTRSTLLVVT
ncbi:5834_t:CDS:1 [Ambispora gerdemannii]|uniref:5834_t:CDS:1 n=1 Tax=Ambispora gerdemannii TaxID=144530 RepID=A0A9N8VS07_9GLOM|nr:5834_t:CDS:1 [Ambispora gerdemannii]